MLHLIQIFFFNTILLLVLIAPYKLIIAQDNQEVDKLFTSFDSRYGKDPNLYKGPKYFIEKNYEFGFPFWKQNNAFTGKLVLNNALYDNLLLRYDVYKQKIILEFTDQFGANTQIILNNNELNSFNLGSNYFIKNPFSDIREAFLLVINNDSISCYIAYRKDYKYLNTISKTGFGYTDVLTKKIIVVADVRFIFTGKRSFLKSLPENVQVPTKKYLSETGMNIRKAGNNQLAELFLYMNNTLQDDHE